MTTRACGAWKACGRAGWKSPSTNWPSATSERYRFIPVGTIEAGTGSAGSLIPPHEYHTIRNPSDKAVAVSLHVYQRTMVRCGVFSPEGDDAQWQSRGERLLGTDQVVVPH